MSQTNERAFETYVEEILLTRGGWKSGSNAEWDKERALFPAQVFAFIQATQEKLWEEMKTLHAAGLEPLLLVTLVKELDAKGSLHVLRHGFKFYGKTFRLARLPGVARGKQIPDRLRPTPVVRNVCGQAPRWRAGRSDVVAVEPQDSGKGKSVRPRFRQ
jgi:hypothetical protein